MTGNCVLSRTIEEFLKISGNEFTGLLKEKSRQTAAWENQRQNLQSALKEKQGRIIFEYGISGFPKVIDVVLLMRGIIFVLEYKNWNNQAEKADLSQTNDYALRLKYFHDKSNDYPIVPILVATDADDNDVAYNLKAIDDVYETAISNSKRLRDVIDYYEKEIGKNIDPSWEKEWEKGIYKASPTIIQAAIQVWNKQNVQGLSKEDGISDPDTRVEAEDYILEIIRNAEKNKKKAIVFVTGVPGAGKTLVGLNVSVRAQEYGASMLSGNGPLVEVLTAALRRNLDKQYKDNKLTQKVKDQYEKIKSKKTQKDKDQIKDKLSVEAILRGVYSYKTEIIEKRLNWQNKPYCLKSKPCSQHVVIYDESQRAWTLEKMLIPGQHGKKDWQKEEAGWEFSEPGILLWDMNQLDWGVFICLVGGGQEIHNGEAGICEWLYTLTCQNPNIGNYDQWEIHIAKDLKGPQYNQKDTRGKSIFDYYDELRDRITEDGRLHLKKGQRTTRSGEVAPFIDKLIEGKATANMYNSFKSYFPIYLTQDVQVAKTKLRELQSKHQALTEEGARIGMLMSSHGKRLRPLGFVDHKETEFLSKTSGWFLDSKEKNIDSSDFLEVALSEFFVQGLELDFCTVLWDADFRYNLKGKKWHYFNFNKHDWTEIVDKDPNRCRKEKNRQETIEGNKKNELSRFYMRNAYRVLLTRARYGMVICVPKGDPDDDTRKESFYDGTYKYLESLGFETI